MILPQFTTCYFSPLLIAVTIQAFVHLMVSLGLFISLVVPVYGWRGRLKLAFHYGREAGILFAMTGSLCVPVLPATVVDV